MESFLSSISVHRKLQQDIRHITVFGISESLCLFAGLIGRKKYWYILRFCVCNLVPVLRIIIQFGTMDVPEEMNSLLRMRGFAEIGKITLIGVTGILVLPLVIGFYDHISLPEILGLIASIFIFQPLAAAIGLGLGIDPIPLLLIMCSFGISVIFVLSGICDIFSERSEWLRSHLKKTEAITQKSGLLKKYGVYALIPFIWVPGVGLYGCVLIAWLFRWRGVKPVSVIFAGWILATLLVLLTSLGILKIIL